MRTQTHTSKPSETLHCRSPNPKVALSSGVAWQTDLVWPLRSQSARRSVPWCLCGWPCADGDESDPADSDTDTPWNRYYNHNYYYWYYYRGNILCSSGRSRTVPRLISSFRCLTGRCGTSSVCTSPLSSLFLVKPTCYDFIILFTVTVLSCMKYSLNFYLQCEKDFRKMRQCFKRLRFDASASELPQITRERQKCETAGRRGELENVTREGRDKRGNVDVKLRHERDKETRNLMGQR